MSDGAGRCRVRQGGAATVDHGDRVAAHDAGSAKVFYQQCLGTVPPVIKQRFEPVGKRGRGRPCSNTRRRTKHSRHDRSMCWATPTTSSARSDPPSARHSSRRCRPDRVERGGRLTRFHGLVVRSSTAFSRWWKRLSDSSTITAQRSVLRLVAKMPVRVIEPARSVVPLTVMARLPPGVMGAPVVREALHFLKEPFAFTLARPRQHGSVWKTRMLGDTVVFFAGPKAFSFFMNPEHFTRRSGSPRFLQELLHPDAVPFLDGDRHRVRKHLLLSAFTDRALASYLPGIFAVVTRFVERWAAAGEQPVAAELSQLAFDIADLLFAASDPAHSHAEVAADFAALIRGTFSPPVNLPFTTYGKAVKARDRLRSYIKRQIATRDGAGSALGVLKAVRGPGGERLSAEELEIEILHFFFAAHGGLTAALAWALVVLGEHPDLAHRLRAEADARLGDGPPTLAEIRALRDARAGARAGRRGCPVAPAPLLC